MKKIVIIISLLTALTILLPISGYGYEGKLLQQSTMMFENGTVTFEGGNSPLVGNNIQGTFYLYYVERSPGNIFQFGGLANTYLNFETGPYIGPAKDNSGWLFDGGGFISVADFFEGVFDDVFITKEGALFASIHGYGGFGIGPDKVSGTLGLSYIDLGVNPDPFINQPILGGVMDLVPLPPSIYLMGSCLLGLAGWRRFRMSR